MRGPRPALRRAGDLALTVAALVGVACLLMTLAGAFFGIRPLIFLSGSMSPTIPGGSLAVARTVPADDLRVGDIVTVPVGSKHLTHRIVTITHHARTATVQLRGDANSTADDRYYEVSSTPRVVASVPELGRLIAWLSRVPGVFVLAGYAALLLALVLQRTRPGSPDQAPPRKRPDRRLTNDDLEIASDQTPRRQTRWSFRAVTTASVLCLGFCWATPAWAVWADAVPVSGSTLTAYTVPPSPSFACGALGFFSVTFNWTAVSGATNYTLHYGTNGASTTTVTGTTSTILTAISGGKAWVQVNRVFAGVTWTSVASQSRTYTVAGLSACS